MNLEWRHHVGTDPAWLMVDGKLIGQWDPVTGKVWKGYIDPQHIGTTLEEDKARTILEAIAMDIYA